ncbi:MAG: methyltransferase domain-containing protein [Burkholderiales bacterium]|nr:methyltransferase domain-containing protein [Burkholderiales bacterium]
MDAARLVGEAAALIEAGRLDDAEALLAAARALDPLDPAVAYRQGLIELDRGRAAAALVEFDRALSFDDANARAHNNRGSALLLLGRVSEAEAAFRGALERDSRLTPPRLNLARLLEQQGHAGAAATLYRDAIRAGIDVGVFTHHLAALEGTAPLQADASWVRATFDNFAPAFDHQLREVLAYRVPEELAALLLEYTADESEILDLGCGTGLVGAALAGSGRRVRGVDLSEKMLALARERGVYAQLACAEVHEFLAAAPTHGLDAVVAADLFIYIGALEQMFAAVARVLRPAGAFAFSVEETVDADYRLLATGRYAQSHDYVSRLAASDFDQIVAPALTLRTENGAPVAGRLYLFRRRG